MNNGERYIIQGSPKDEKKYSSLLQPEKQRYWNKLFTDYARSHAQYFYPIKLSDYLKRDPNFEEFLPEIIDVLFTTSFGKLRQILQYDTDTKKYFVQYGELEDVQAYYKQQGYSLTDATQETQENVNKTLQSEE